MTDRKRTRASKEADDAPEGRPEGQGTDSADVPEEAGPEPQANPIEPLVSSEIVRTVEAPADPAGREGNDDDASRGDSPDGSGRRVRYDGLIDVFRLGRYRWGPGTVVRVADDDVEEVLTHPGGDFTLLEDTDDGGEP